MVSQLTHGEKKQFLQKYSTQLSKKKKKDNDYKRYKPFYLQNEMKWNNSVRDHFS